jgi:DNA-binding NtrC family response regulator
MARETIVVLGNITNGHAAMEPLLSEFNWSLENALTLDGLADICSRQDVVAVLVDPAVVELPWKQAISAVQEAAPRALPILCHRFSEAIDWTEASAIGAFHLLGLPLDLGELRQSLGFVWAEKNKRRHVISLTAHERSRLRKSPTAGARGSGATAHVA